MKKLSKIVVLTLAMVVLFAVYALSACGGDSDSGGGGGKANEKIQIASKMFTNFHVDLSDSKGLGIAERDKTKTKDKNYMVSLTEDGTLKDVVFLSDNNEETTQEEIAGQIAKLCVTEKFTFMMFAKNASAIGGEDFNITGYYCNDKQQSFIIDNASGKIYSLEEVCGDSYMRIEDGYVQVPNQRSIRDIGGKSFVLSIKDGNLLFTDITLNSTLEYYDIVCDKFGNYYVAVNALDEKIENIFYYNYVGGTIWTGVKYCKGNDGYVYKVEIINKFDINGGKGSIKRMGENFEEIDIGSNATTSIIFEFNTKIIIKGKSLLYAYGTNLSFASYEDGKFIQADHFYLSGGQTAFIGTELFFLGNTLDNYKKLYHYDWLTQTEAFVFDGINNLVTEGTRLYAIAESVTGTKKYQITFENNEAKVTLVSEKTYDRTIITIQPLN